MVLYFEDGVELHVNAFIWRGLDRRVKEQLAKGCTLLATRFEETICLSLPWETWFNFKLWFTTEFEHDLQNIVKCDALAAFPFSLN